MVVKQIHGLDKGVCNMKYWELIKTTDRPETFLNVNKSTPTPPGFDETILDDEEVNEVLSMLLEFQEKYFKDMPLADTLEQRFVWNLPKSIYKAAMRVKDFQLIDCLNPLYWFYIFCTADPWEMLPKFLITAVNAITDDEFDTIEKMADEYDKNREEEPDDSE